MANEDEPTPTDEALPPISDNAFEIIVDGKPVRFIDSTEVCRRLGIDRATLTRWIQLRRITHAGKMPGDSGAYLWDPAYITEYAIKRGQHQQQPHAS